MLKDVDSDEYKDACEIAMNVSSICNVLEAIPAASKPSSRGLAEHMTQLTVTNARFYMTRLPLSILERMLIRLERKASRRGRTQPLTQARGVKEALARLSVVIMRKTTSKEREHGYARF